MEECVFSTNDQTEALQVSEILKENNIDHYLKNFSTQNLLSEMQMFTGIDLVAGQIEIMVKGEDVEKCITAGMNDHLGKPIAIHDVLMVMSHYLLLD